MPILVFLVATLGGVGFGCGYTAARIMVERLVEKHFPNDGTIEKIN